MGSMLAEVDGLTITTEGDLGDLTKICQENFRIACSWDGLPSELVEDQEAHEAQDEDVKKAARGDGFSARGKVASYWQRCLKDRDGLESKLALDYKKCASAFEKKRFKESWAKLEFKDVLTEKSQSEGYTDVQGSNDEWHTLGSLIRSYGGYKYPPAIVGAKIHAAKAARLGRLWCKIDEMSTLMHFRKEVQVGNKLLTKGWATLAKFYTDSHNASAPSGAASGADDKRQEVAKVEGNNEVSEAKRAKGADGTRTRSKGAGKSKDSKGKEVATLSKEEDAANQKAEEGARKKAEELRKKAEEEKDKERRKKAEQQLADKVKEANKVKATVAKALSDTKGLLEVFKTDPKYSWGMAKEIGGSLQAKVECLEGKLVGFGNEFLLQPLSVIKGNYQKDPAELLRGLKQFITLEKESDQLKDDATEWLDRIGRKATGKKK